MNREQQVSVIVVSHGRPQDLRLCLTSLAQLTHCNFEIVVVADEVGLAAVEDLGWLDRIKTVRVDEANVSIARNAGLAAAAGSVVAFIDDDAVAEPTWLSALTAPFSDRAVTAATGFVRGRNGISFQWKAKSVDAAGYASDLDVDGNKISVLTPPAGTAIKTVGTNMAFRRDVLTAIGGFDPAFRYYLEETDVNFRLAQRGAATAIVPMAEVHHHFQSSDRRRGDRTPLTLAEVGASKAVFMRKHTPSGQEAAEEAEFVTRQKRRLVNFMVAGYLEPGDVLRLMQTLSLGFSEGSRRPLNDLSPIGRSKSEFQPFKILDAGAGEVVSGRLWRAKAHRRKAAALAKAGKRATLFLFSRTAVFHRVRFNKDGYWEHRGGIFGKSERSQPIFRLATFGGRVREEIRRIGIQRGFSGAV